MIKALLALLALTIPAIAVAANEVSVVNEIFVEKTVPVSPGKSRTVLVSAKSGPPGTKLVFVTTYKNQSKLPIRGIVLNSPALSNLEFDGALTPGSEVSIDGAKSWGQLATLKVRTQAGTLRAAQNADVTHVRLVVAGVAAPGSSGKLSYRVIVK